MKSAVLATSLAVHRPTWKLVDRFLPVGSAVARHLEEIGIDASKITVRGNPVADPGPPSPPGNGGALFAGRLAREKGPHLLLAAWERSGLGAHHRLRFVGDGREEDLIKQSARDIPGVEFLGHVEHARALELMEESSFVVVPSMWDEPFGLAVVEAMARGRPVLVTKLGEPAEMVRPGTGWVADPTVDAFAHALRDAFVSPLDEIGRNARRRYEERYAPAVALRTLLDAYSDVLEKRPAGSAATAE
jgi:glycosyltransferase involved in cell wall biosynthesis